jgi:hypothetical protein
MPYHMSNKTFEVVNNFVMKSLDKKIEKHGLSRGISEQLYTMRKVRLKIGTVPMHFIEETLILELTDFENELKKNLVIAENEGIGAYRYNDDHLELFLVRTKKGVLMM